MWAWHVALIDCQDDGGIREDKAIDEEQNEFFCIHRRA